MDRLVASGPARPLRAVLRILVATTALAMPGAPVPAQQPAPKAAPPAQPKAAQPKAPAGQPKAAPAPAAPAASPQAAFVPAEQLPKLDYTPWTKFCMKPPDGDANAKPVCFTGSDGRLENGRAFVSVVLIEPEGIPRKILKIMLPLGLQLPPGTRVSVDAGQPMTAPYAICIANGCYADYEASDELISRMKQGQSLVLQGLAPNNQVLSLSVPLAEFAKGYDGPPVDPKVMEEQQKKAQDKLQEELERRAKELQKGAPPAPGKAQ